MRTYSPSSMSQFEFCGTARQLKKAGWAPKWITAQHVAQWVGSAVAAGLDGYHRGYTMPFLFRLAWEEYEKRKNQVLDAGGLFGQTALDSEDKAKTRIKDFLHLAIEKDPLKSWKIVASEMAYDMGGRADLVAYNEEGQLCILDYKCITTWDKRKQMTKWFNSHFHGNQAMCYKFFHESQFKEMVEKFYICLLTLSEDEPILRGIAYDPIRYGLWLDSAEVMWRRMEVEDETDTPSTENSTHQNQWGACEYYDACLYHGRDADRMRDDYIQIERL